MSTTLPPGPSLPPWLQLMQFLYRPQRFLGSARERFGTPFTFRLPGLPPFVSFCDPAAVKDVFTGSPQELYAGQANIVLKPFLGPHSVLVLDGDRHMEQRRLLLPPFRGDRMKSYGGAMIDITRERMARWGRAPLRMQTETQAITLEVILRTVFGMQEGREKRTEALRSCLLKMLKMLDNPLSIVKEFQRDFGPWSPWRRFLKLRTRMRGLIMDEVADRRVVGRGDRNDVLSMLIEATHEDGTPMSDEEIRDELVTMLVAGHETTATGLSWTIHRLSKHPDVLRRVQEELDRVYPDGRVTPDELHKLEYLDAVAKETLRVHPVIPGVGRVLQVPTRIGGVDLPEGTIVACSIVLANTNPDVWDEPERFDPDRFVGKRVSPYEFYPFGGGVRRCIGEAFALWEMRAVLATVLREREPVAIAPVRTVRRNITLSPSLGLPIRFRPRRN